MAKDWTLKNPIIEMKEDECCDWEFREWRQKCQVRGEFSAKRKCLTVSDASRKSSVRTNKKDLWFSNWSFVVWID